MGHRTWLTGFFLAAAVLLAACGSDKLTPGDPTFSSEPDTVFFNTAEAQPRVLFEGRATDNRWVEQVLISFDNAATWHTAEIDPVPSVRDVRWAYLASESDMPSVSNTVLVKVIDQDANENTSSPVSIEKQTGSTIGNLEALFSGASSGDVIALSSGSGGAYGNGVNPLTIPVLTSMTVLGAGYGSALTSGGVAPAVASTATVLEAPLSAASMFSVEEDFALKGVRLVGAITGISVAGTPGGDPYLSVEDCLFDGQDAWAVFAMDDDSQTTFDFMSSIIDASTATSTSRGGIYLENISYNVSGSDLFWQTDPLGPADLSTVGAGVQVVGGTGTVKDCLFVDNGLAIWASGGSPVIASCYISGATAVNSYGINLSGESDSVEISDNTIDGNSGYGLRIGGEMTPKVRRNVISNNEYSGILIDFSGDGADTLNIDLGKTSDFGNNDLFDNIHPGVTGDTQLYVTSTTPAYGTGIPAEWNYWGVASTIVESVVYHGFDAPGRAMVDFSPAFNSEQN